MMLKWMRSFLWPLAFFFATQALAVGEPEVSGNLDRSKTASSFKMRIRIPKTKKPDLQDGETSLKNRIEIRLISDDNKPLPYEPKDDPRYYVEEIENSPIIEANKDDATYSDITFIVKVSAQDPNKFTNNTVKVSVFYYEDAAVNGTRTVSSKKENVEISRNLNVPDETPQGLAVQGSHKTLIIQWNDIKTINFTDGQKRDATGMAVVVLDRSRSQTDLPAKLFDSKNPETSDSAPLGTCRYNPKANSGGTCITCDDVEGKRAYLDLDQLKEDENQDKGVFVETSVSGRSSIKSLENDHQYHIALMYLPDGLKQSSCLIATPIGNYTYAELNGEDDAEEKDARCFIATAAFGSGMHWQLRYFWWFRDKILMHLPFGKKMVRTYYKVSPPFADFIASHATLRTATRFALYPILGLIVLMRESTRDPWAAGLLVLAAFVVLGIFFRRPKLI